MNSRYSWIDYAYESVLVNDKGEILCSVIIHHPRRGVVPRFVVNLTGYVKEQTFISMEAAKLYVGSLLEFQ